jgi:PKD repeat protein
LKPVQYLWDFDDGQTSPLEKLWHTFPNSGLYHVRLTVTNADGISAESRFPVLIIVGTTNTPGPVGNTLKLVKEPLASSTLRFTWINIPPDQAAWYNLYEFAFTDKSLLPSPVPPQPPAVQKVPLGIPGTTYTPAQNSFFFQVRGLSCDGLKVGP